MPRKNQAIDGLLMEMEDATKIRKRGCSPTSSSSSVIQNYRLKRAVLVGKRGPGCGSTTPVPTWRITSSRSPSIAAIRAVSGMETPRSSTRAAQPVSARKLGATLWEMNEVPTLRAPAAEDRIVGGGRRTGGDKRRENLGKRINSVLGSLPSNLSDPSHSPVSERSDRSVSSHWRRQCSTAGRRLSVTANDLGSLDAASNASYMETETRSRYQDPFGSTGTSSCKNRLKDVRNALTTSKELVKIMSRMQAQEGHHHHHHQPSSSKTLISALYAELEQTGLQVNQLIEEKRSEQDEVNSLLKKFTREREAVEAAVQNVAKELEVEIKLRRRLESMNKKLGQELAETKASLARAVMELESEKRVRGEMERVCDELAWNIGEDRAELEGKIKRESMIRWRDEVERDREMMISEEAKFEENSQAVDQLRTELEAFLSTKSKTKEKAQYHSSLDRDAKFSFIQDGGRRGKGIGIGIGIGTGTGIGIDAGEGTDDDEEGSAESDLHSIELNKDGHDVRNNLMSSAYASPIRTPRSGKQLLSGKDEVVGGRKSVYSGSGQERRRGVSLLRSMSNVMEWGNPGQSSPQAEYEFDGLSKTEKLAHRRSCGDHDLQRYKSVKGLREQILSNYRNKDTASPARKWP